MTFGELVKQVREECDMSQGDLAKYLEVAQQTVSRWEAGLADPFPRQVVRIADALGLDREEALRAADYL